tara:strand:+ start:6059 stop:6307 length:249 start_codon:yes stop_codon:yes gene_type:complete
LFFGGKRRDNGLARCRTILNRGNDWILGQHLWLSVNTCQSGDAIAMNKLATQQLAVVPMTLLFSLSNPLNQNGLTQWNRGER